MFMRRMPGTFTLHCGRPVAASHTLISRSPVADARRAADGVLRYDVLVVEQGGCLRLFLEALQLLGVQRGGERQHFERHAPPQRDLLRFVDHAHAAAADFANNAVIAQLQTDLHFGRTVMSVCLA